jgi:DNA-binding transcriptional ArsR family regulator
LVAHIGNIPVEESLPFLVPIVALYLYGRHRGRLRRAALARLPDPSEALDDHITERVIDAWKESNHGAVSREHLRLLYPPGPDGMSATDLATKLNAEPAAVERLLAELEDLDYLELEEQEGLDERRAWLTFRGYELVNTTEQALLGALGQRRVENSAP